LEFKIIEAFEHDVEKERKSIDGSSPPKSWSPPTFELNLKVTKTMEDKKV